MPDEDKKDKDTAEKNSGNDEIIYGSWSPDDGVVLEWMGRAEGLSDEQ